MAVDYGLAFADNNYGTGANWSLGAAPVSTNDAYLEGITDDITASLNQVAVLLNSFNIDQRTTGKIGTATTYLILGFGAGKVANLGYQLGGAAGSGSGRRMINFGAFDVTVNLYNTAVSGFETGKPPDRYLFNEAGAKLNAYKGSFGIACTVPGEVSVIGTINIGYTDSISSDVNATLGPGVTVTTINKTGGILFTQSLPTTLKHSGGTATLSKMSGTLATLNLDGGTVDTDGAFAITAVNATAGTFVSNSVGTITALNLSGGALADFLQSNAARTATAITVAGSCTIKSDSSVLAVTNGINITASKTVRCVATAA